MVAPKNRIEPQRLRELLRYEPDTGRLFWLERPGSTMFNSRYAGREALTYQDPVTGYRQGMVDGVMVKAHRVAWAIANNQWPDIIDHVSGDGSDNRIANLRSASFTENMRNRKLNKNNRSGVCGVHQDTRSGRWVATIGSGPGLPQRRVGFYRTKAEAAQARQKAEAGRYHPNHGRIGHAPLPHRN